MPDREILKFDAEMGYSRGSMRATFSNHGGSGEIRTRDQRIKSPLLYRLSYRPRNSQIIASPIGRNLVIGYPKRINHPGVI